MRIVYLLSRALMHQAHYIDQILLSKIAVDYIEGVYNDFANRVAEASLD